MAKNHVKIPKEILDLYRDLAEVKNEDIGKLTIGQLAESDIQIHHEQKAPLLSFVELNLDEVKIRQVLDKVSEIFLKHRPQLEDQINHIKSALKKRKGVLTKVCKDFIWQKSKSLDNFSKKNELDKELLSLLIYHTVKPFMAVYAAALRGRSDDQEWLTPSCPVCGWVPDLAYEDAETRQREVHCSLCDTKWHYKNLKCIHCGNEDHNTLKYFSVDGDEVYRVYTCDKCHGYIKSVSRGKLLNEEDSANLDINTLHLDVLAQNEGYTREVASADSKKIN